MFVEELSGGFCLIQGKQWIIFRNENSFSSPDVNILSIQLACFLFHGDCHLCSEEEEWPSFSFTTWLASPNCQAFSSAAALSDRVISYMSSLQCFHKGLFVAWAATSPYLMVLRAIADKPPCLGSWVYLFFHWLFFWDP